MRHWILLIGLFALVACKGDRTPPESESAVGSELTPLQQRSSGYYDAIFLPEEPGIFRAQRFDRPQAEVRSAEDNSGLQLREEKEGYLQYDTDLERDTVHGIDYAEVKYIFDEFDRLDIITVNYYIQDSSVTNSLFDLLNAEFNGSYGDYYIDSDGYTVWESTYLRPDSTEVVFDIGIRKLIKLNDPGITIELMRFGAL